MQNKNKPVHAQYYRNHQRIFTQNKIISIILSNLIIYKIEIHRLSSASTTTTKNNNNNNNINNKQLYCAQKNCLQLYI